MVQTKVTEVTPQPALLGKCFGCGEPGALYSGHYDDHFCPACVTMQLRYDQAGKHLEALIRPTIEAWVKHYQAAGLTPLETREVSEQVTGNLVEELLQKVFPA